MKRWLILPMVLSLVILIILPACGGDEDEEINKPTATSTTAQNPITTSVTAPSPADAMEPVKIGAIMPWSGPQAMSGMLVDQAISVVQDQVKEMGGILDGREIKFVKGDDRGVLAESVAQAKKLILDDKVTILTLGGLSAAGYTAVADVAEDLKAPYVAFATIHGVESKKYSACLYSNDPLISRTANFLIDVLKPKTVAFLGYESNDSHDVIDGTEGVEGVKDRLKAEGINLISEQYFPAETIDFSPYLTKIKYLNPDVVVTFISDQGYAINLNKQITELGGWGSIKYFGASEATAGQAVIKIPVAVGTYVSVLWLPGSDDPGMKTFEDAFLKKFNRLPDPALTYFYNDFWAAIKAIQLAGTDDREKVAQVLRSGNLEWDSAWGHLRIGTNGIGQINMMVAQVQEGGKLIEVWPQDKTAVSPGTPAPTITPTKTGAIHTGLDINSSIGDLIGNPNTAAILDKWIPGFSTDPNVAQAYNFTLPFIQPYSQGTITQEQVDGIAADLLKIK